MSIDRTVTAVSGDMASPITGPFCSMAFPLLSIISLTP
jgi:hypothetical protein